MMIPRRILIWVVVAGLILIVFAVQGVRLFAQSSDATSTPIPFTSAWTPAPITPRFTPVTIAPRLTLPATITPVPARSGPISYIDTENLFPVAVRFGAVVEFGKDDLVSAEIHIWQPGSGFDRTETVDIPSSIQVLTDKQTQFNYMWMITPENVPEPFTKLRYEWTIKISGNRTIRASGDFTFEDSRRPEAEPGTWQRFDGVVSLFSANPELALGMIGTQLGRAYTRLAADFGLTTPYRFVIYEPGVQFCLEEASGTGTVYYTTSRVYGLTRRDCDPTSAPRLYAARGYTMVVRTSMALDALEDRMAAIMTGDAVDGLWAEAAAPSVWLREALIQLYGISPRTWALPLVRNAQRGSGVLSLAEMAKMPDAPETIRLWQAESYLMALYLADRFGASAPLTLLRAVQNGFSVEDGLTTMFNVTPDTWFLAWESWLQSDAALRATRWSPYLAATATVTSTATTRPSITPTSNIPTATRTPTITLTAATTLEKSPIGPTPTNTPLPAGSLNRATNVPTPTPAPPARQTGPCGGSLAVMLLPAGAVVIAATQSRRLRRITRHA